MTLREKLITEFNRIYFSKQRKGSLAEDVADAFIVLLEKAK